MATATIVDRAHLTPGKCFLSGDFNGPFVDTGHSIRGIGRIYLAVKHLGPLMRAAGWVPSDEVLQGIEDAVALREESEELRERAELADALVAAVSPLLPKPTPIEVQVPVTDRKVLRQLETALEKQAELREIAANLQARIDGLIAAQKATTEATPTSDAEGSGSEAGEAKVIEIAGQPVNLDDLLGRKAKDVISVAEGWDITDRYALAERERELAAEKGRDERVTIIRLGDADAGGEGEEQ